MTDDPYAAPHANIEAASASGGLSGGTGSFDVGQATSDAWRTTIQNLPAMIGVYVIGTILMYVGLIAFVFVTPVLLFGFTKYYINAYDGEGEFGDLFVGFSNYGTVLGQMLGFFLLMIVIFVGAASVQYVGIFTGNESLTLIGGLISMIFHLIVGVRLYWSVMFVVDQGMGPVDAIKASWNATSGNWFRLVLLMLVAFAVVLAGILALGVGILVAAPMTQVMLTASYRQCVGSPSR